ncbi:MAG: alanine racemase [Coxiellaceae bacterium]|nr:alanine racemase [Coxiellaceae bacterium]
MNQTAIATVTLDHVRNNIRQLRAMIPGKKILAMVKSNAYGHGLVPIAQTLSDVDALGVATIGEALQLRVAGITQKIVVMRGFITQEELHLFLRDPGLVACIHDHQQLALLKQSVFSEKDVLTIWLKIDTGMHRLGFDYHQFSDVYSTLMQLPVIKKPFVVCSHLADADNMDAVFTEQQIHCFEKITKTIQTEKSILNSAGILAYPEAAFDWIRPGLMMYGISPFATNDPRNSLMKDFRPAMTLSSKLIAIKDVKKGEKIGYSCTFVAPSDMTIGIVGMGYGDSYPRQAKNGTPVLIRDQRCPIVGRVSMDMITVDISHVKNAAVDDTVILWGEQLLVSEIAENVNTVSHELLCHLTGRVLSVIVP